MTQVSVQNRFDEIFFIELDAWCHGINTYPGEPFPALVFRAIKELGLTFREAIRNYYAFDILATSKNLSKAAHFVVAPKEVAFAILMQLPNPIYLDEAGQSILANVIDQVEKQYGGAVEALQGKWSRDRHEMARDLADAGGTDAAAEIESQKEVVAVQQVPERPCAFFSHNSRDKQVVRRVTDGLQEQGVQVWLDERELEAVGSVYLPIERAITDSQYILVGISQHSVGSDWVKQEMRMAVRKLADGQPRVFVALRFDDAALPWWLDGIAYFDFRRPEDIEGNCRELAGWMIGTLPKLEVVSRQQSPLTFDDDLSTLWSNPSNQPEAPAITDTRGWSAEQLRDAVDTVKRDKLGWEKAEGSARHWWNAFENENAGRPALVLRLVEELALRGATIDEFFLAFVRSRTDNLQAILHYMDYDRLKRKSEKSHRKN